MKGTAAWKASESHTFTFLSLFRINRFRSLRYIAKYLVTREHLLEKAALFLAKAYIVYKVGATVMKLLCVVAVAGSDLIKQNTCSAARRVLSDVPSP